MLAAALLAIALTLSGAAALVALAGRGARDDASRRALFAAALCVAPTVLAWLLGMLWRVVPGLSAAATLALLAVPALGAALAGRRAVAQVVGAVRMPARLDLAVLCAAFVAIAVFTLRLPAYSNDPLEYAAVAELLHATRSVAGYPVLDGPAADGLYAPWTHPPGFPLLIVLLRLCGAPDVASALKLVAALHVGVAMAAFGLVMSRRAGVLAALALVAAPAYLMGAMNGYVEAPRLAVLVGAFAACLALRTAPAAVAVPALGVAFAACGYVHSLGILASGLLLPGWLLLRPGSMARRALLGAAVLAVQLAVLAPDLARNVALFGVPLGDRPALWQLPQVGRVEYFREFRDLGGAGAIVTHGLLQGFTQITNFALTYWVPVIALGVWAWRRRSPAAGAAPQGHELRPQLVLAGSAFVAYYAMMLALTAAGSVEAVKNARYTLTVQPFLAVLTAAVLLHGRLPRWLLALSVCALLGSSGVPFAYMAERYPQALLAGGPLREGYFALVHPESDAVRQVDARSRAGACTLVFRQADPAVYGSGCFRGYLDHRFADVYTAAGADQAAERLRAHGIRYLMLPDYAMPEVYNTAVGALAADPLRSTLLWNEDGYRFLELAPGASGTVAGGADEPPADAGAAYTLPWSRLVRQAPPHPDATGVLCAHARGQGRVEAVSVAPGYRAPAGIVQRLVHERGSFVMGAAVNGERLLCAQVSAREAAGALSFALTRSARLVRIEWSWALPVSTDLKDH